MVEKKIEIMVESERKGYAEQTSETYGCQCKTVMLNMF